MSLKIVENEVNGKVYKNLELDSLEPKEKDTIKFKRKLKDGEASNDDGQSWTWHLYLFEYQGTECSLITSNKGLYGELNTIPKNTMIEISMELEKSSYNNNYIPNYTIKILDDDKKKERVDNIAEKQKDLEENKELTKKLLKAYKDNDLEYEDSIKSNGETYNISDRIPRQAFLDYMKD